MRASAKSHDISNSHSDLSILRLVSFNGLFWPRPNGCHENINSAKRFWDLKPIPAAFEDPSAGRDSDYIENHGAGLFRKCGDALVNLISWSARAIDREVCRQTRADVSNKFIAALKAHLYPRFRDD